jgi:hypothetical protein
VFTASFTAIPALFTSTCFSEVHRNSGVVFAEDCFMILHSKRQKQLKKIKKKREKKRKRKRKLYSHHHHRWHVWKAGLVTW